MIAHHQNGVAFMLNLLRFDICDSLREEVSNSIQEHNRVEYGKAVQYIINRNGDGVCPMEQATAQISDPPAAFEAIKQRLAQLGASNIR